jgi:ParB family chromosome partitioning protein
MTTKEVARTADTPETPKRRGRPPKPTQPYPGPTFGIDEGKVEQVALDDLRLDDTTYQFRVALNAEALVDSVKTHGIQIPLIARRLPKTGKLQLVCGFRRANAARLAGLERVPVVVRELSDEQAHILSYAENEFRRTMNDLDRAHAIAKLRETGKTVEQVAELYRLSDRQVRRLQELQDYPDVVRRAVADEESGVTTTHALLLMQAERRYRAFDVAAWIRRVRKERLSVDDLRQAIRQEVGSGRRKTAPFRKRGDRVVFSIKALQEAPARTREAAVRQLREILKELKD